MFELSEKSDIQFGVEGVHRLSIEESAIRRKEVRGMSRRHSLHRGYEIVCKLCEDDDIQFGGEEM